MSTPTEIMALLDPATPDTWPQGILAAADLREGRANAATPEPWCVADEVDGIFAGQATVVRRGMGVRIVSVGQTRRHDADRAEANAQHIAAEANPAHALAAVRHWRGVVKRHVREADSEYSVCRHCVMSGDDGYVSGVESWPCPDLTETADEARAYLGGTP